MANPKEARSKCHPKSLLEALSSQTPGSNLTRLSLLLPASLRSRFSSYQSPEGVGAFRLEATTAATPRNVLLHLFLLACLIALGLGLIA